jgi:phenylalanyl-tRNA synthetase alpha chain
METHKDDLPDKPIRIIAPGRVFRSEATDARHEAIFHQIEGLAVGEGITLAHLKGTLEKGFSEFFGTAETIRMRPGYFPFVEPGIEVDAKCFKCDGTDASCGVCKGTGWIELMGAGMVHPKVLSNVGIDPKKYTGFAFGTGIERLAMVKYNIPDVRMFLSGDLRVINQF